MRFEFIFYNSECHNGIGYEGTDQHGIALDIDKDNNISNLEGFGDFVNVEEDTLVEFLEDAKKEIEEIIEKGYSFSDLAGNIGGYQYYEKYIDADTVSMEVLEDLIGIAKGE